MSTLFIRRRQAQHLGVGVLSDTDQWQSHGRRRQTRRDGRVVTTRPRSTNRKATT